MGFFKKKKGSVISEHFKLLENVAMFSKGYMYEVALYDTYLEITSLQKKTVTLNSNFNFYI